MLQGSYQSVLGVNGRDEFQSEVVKFAKNLGFNTVTAIAVYDRFLGQPDFVSIDNAPSAFRSIAFETELAMARKDPVMQHCKTSSRPIIWDQSTYVGSGCAELWEGQAAFGFRTGIAMALHLPDGRHFQLGVDRDQALPKNPTELARMVADLQLFAVYAHEAAARVLLPPKSKGVVPKLTARELEALRWTIEGKTAWEVGKILGIAERTAVFHVNNAMHKLACSSKHRAAVKAKELGLL